MPAAAAFFTAAVLCAQAFGADAPEPKPISLSFADAARVALSENPDLLGLRYQEEASRYQARAALAPNNPTFGVNKNDMPGLSLTSTGASTVYVVTWTLGFPGKALSTSAGIRHQAEALREQSASKEIGVLSALSNNYVQLTADQKLYAFLQEELTKNTQLVRLLEKKYAAAQASQADVLNQRVVVANTTHDLLDNRNDYDQQLTQFRNLIKKPGDLRFLPIIPDRILIPEMKKSLSELSEVMLRNRHELKAAGHQTEAAQAALTNAALAPLPDFQLSGQLNVYNLTSAEQISNVNRDYSVGLAVQIPIFYPFNELSGLQAAVRIRDAAEAQQESARLQALSDLQTAFTSFSSAKKSIDNFEKLVLPATKASYDLTLTTYSLGKADYFVLNQARQNWVQAQKDMLSKQVQAAQAYNQIVQQLGCDVNNGDGPDACK